MSDYLYPFCWVRLGSSVSISPRWAKYGQRSTTVTLRNTIYAIRYTRLFEPSLFRVRPVSAVSQLFFTSGKPLDSVWNSDETNLIWGGNVGTTIYLGAYIGADGLGGRKDPSKIKSDRSNKSDRCYRKKYNKSDRRVSAYFFPWAYSDGSFWDYRIIVDFLIYTAYIYIVRHGWR